MARVFYKLTERFTRGAMRFRVPHIASWEQAAALARGELFPPDPVVFEWHSGTRPRDICGTTWATSDLISDATLDLFRSHDFTGWTTYPVEVYGRDSQPLQGLHGLAITGRCGPTEWVEYVWVDPPVPQGQGSMKWRGLRFDESSWDGSDLFMAEGRTSIFATEEVVRAIRKAKLKNFNMRPLSEMIR